MPKKNIPTAICIWSAAVALTLIFSVSAVAQVETIDATARGTSTQMGQIGNIRLIVPDKAMEQINVPPPSDGESMKAVPPPPRPPQPATPYRLPALSKTRLQDG